MFGGIFDYEDGKMIYQNSSNTAMDMDGNLFSKMSNNMAMNLETGELHITSSWNNDDEDDEW